MHCDSRNSTGAHACKCMGHIARVTLWKPYIITQSAAAPSTTDATLSPPIICHGGVTLSVAEPAGHLEPKSAKPWLPPALPPKQARVQADGATRTAEGGTSSHRNSAIALVVRLLAVRCLVRSVPPTCTAALQVTFGLQTSLMSPGSTTTLALFQKGHLDTW